MNCLIEAFKYANLFEHLGANRKQNYWTLGGDVFDFDQQFALFMTFKCLLGLLKVRFFSLTEHLRRVCYKLLENVF